jgi:hypothetical protein
LAELAVDSFVVGFAGFGFQLLDLGLDRRTTFT